MGALTRLSYGESPPLTRIISERGREQREAGSLGTIIKTLGSPTRVLLILK